MWQNLQHMCNFLMLFVSFFKWEQRIYLVEEYDNLSQFEPVENTDIVQCWYSQNGYSQLLP